MQLDSEKHLSRQRKKMHASSKKDLHSCCFLKLSVFLHIFLLPEAPKGQGYEGDIYIKA